MKNLWKKIWSFLVGLFSRPESNNNALGLGASPSLSLETLAIFLPTEWLQEQNFPSLDIQERLEAHAELQKLLQTGANDQELAHKALGNLNYHFNYCAQEWREDSSTMAIHIEETNEDWEKKVADLLKELNKAGPGKVPEVLNRHPEITYLKISITSEMAMVLAPSTHTVINKRVLFYFFKVRPLPEFISLTDQELLKKIVKNHAVWERYYPTLLLFLEELYQKILKPSFPNETFKFFYTERFCSLFYESVFKENKEP